MSLSIHSAAALTHTTQSTSATTVVSSAWALLFEATQTPSEECGCTPALPLQANTLVAASFSGLLEEAGITGQTLPSNDRAEALKADFREWKEKYFTQGITEERRQRVEEYSADYEALLDKAVAENAYAKPKAFVESLSVTELKTLQHIHCHAQAIQPEALTEEGALNLLYPPGSGQDIDHDGFQMVGAAKTWTFPPANAPASVKKAWEETTAGLEFKDIMLMQIPFMPIVIEGVTSENAAYIPPNADYVSMFQNTIASLEYMKKFDEPWQRETRQRQIDLLGELLVNLQSQQSAATASATSAKQETSTTETTRGTSSAREEFLAWAQMSWEERFVITALKKRGMTKEEFDALPPAEQKKIMTEIRAEMREAIRHQAEEKKNKL